MGVTSCFFSQTVPGTTASLLPAPGPSIRHRYRFVKIKYALAEPFDAGNQRHSGKPAQIVYVLDKGRGDERDLLRCSAPSKCKAQGPTRKVSVHAHSQEHM